MHVSSGTILEQNSAGVYRKALSLHCTALKKILLLFAPAWVAGGRYASQGLARDMRLPREHPGEAKKTAAPLENQVLATGLPVGGCFSWNWIKDPSMSGYPSNCSDKKLLSGDFRPVSGPPPQVLSVHVDDRGDVEHGAARPSGPTGQAT